VLIAVVAVIACPIVTADVATAWPSLAIADLALYGLPPLGPALAVVPITSSERESEPLVHIVQSGDTLNRIAADYRARSGYYGQEDLLDAIRRENDLTTNLLHPGQKLLIPCLARQDYPQAAIPAVAGRNLRGIYLTGALCGYGAAFERIDAFVAAGGNGVVFDVKDIDGGVSFRSTQPLAAWGKGRSAPPIPSLIELIDRLDARGLYVVARIALFLDGELGRQRPDLALQDTLGQPWAERGCVWVDPANPEVWAYNLGLAAELARAGVDEIQFDYVRFPTNGWRGDWQGDLASTAARRRGVITNFLQAAQDSLAPYDVVISADLFGIMAWGRVQDLALTGQHVPTFAEHVDVICPMIYPSHFGPGFEDFANPGDHPRYFITEGVRRFAELAAGKALIRPWLQAFRYRVRDYDARYVADQMEAAAAAGATGWCLWNPAGRYEIACAAMSVPPELVAEELWSALWFTGPAIVMAPQRLRPAAPVPSIAQASAPPILPLFDLLLAAPPVAVPALLSAAAGPSPAGWSLPPDRAVLTGAAASYHGLVPRRH